MKLMISKMCFAVILVGLWACPVFAGDQQKLLGASETVSSAMALPLPARTDKDGYILDWLTSGPLKSSGLTKDSIFYEQFATPDIGDVISMNKFWSAYRSSDKNIDMKTMFPKHRVSGWPPGNPSCIYAMVYIISPQTDCWVEVTGKYSAVKMLLNGLELPASGKASIFNARALQPGVNRLMLKIHNFQTEGKPWNFKCRVLGLDKKPIRGVKFFLNNPESDARELRAKRSKDFKPGQAPSDRIKLAIENPNCGDKVLFIWYEDKPVEMDLVLGSRSDKEMEELFPKAVKYASWKQIDAEAYVQILDLWGGRAFTGKFPVTITPGKDTKVHLDLGKIKRGHYTVRVILKRNKGGWLLNRGAMLRKSRYGMPPMQFAVISHEVNNTPPELSKMSSANYWLAGKPEFSRRFMLGCHLMGVRFKLSTRSWYWASETPESIFTKPASQWKWNPNIDTAVAAAKEYGIEIAGDLDGWWPVKASPARNASNHRKVDDKAVIFCNLGNRWFNIGRYYEPKAEKIIDKYTYECVKRYKDRIRYWKFHNEVNLFRDKGFTPEVYGRLLEVASKAARRADPKCIIISASLAGSDVNFLDRLISLGYDRYFDIVDIHNYSWGYRGGKKLLTGQIQDLLVKRGIDKPIIIGETGHFRMYPSSNGMLGQAQQLTKWFTNAMKITWIKRVCFGLGNGGHEWLIGGSSGPPYPAWLALRTTALMIDGAEFIDEATVAGVQISNFKKAGKYVSVLWTPTAKPAKLSFKGDVELVDIMDRRSKLPAGKVITVDRTPVFVVGKKPIEATKPN